LFLKAPTGRNRNSPRRSRGNMITKMKKPCRGVIEKHPILPFAHILLN